MSAYQENFFTRGPSALARLTFFSLVAIAIMIAAGFLGIGIGFIALTIVSLFLIAVAWVLCAVT